MAAFLAPSFARPPRRVSHSAAGAWRCSASVEESAASTATLASQPIDGGVTAARGFRAAGVTAGLKPSGASDLAVVLSDTSAPAAAGAVFTKSLVRAAPVDLTAAHLSQSGGLARAVVLNAGQANAATGAGGAEDARETVRAAARALQCPEAEVLLCSTGVIGVRPAVERILAALPSALSQAGATRAHAAAAARAITTTDLRPKESARRCAHTGVVVGGMAKGSGMIHPDMATLLAVLTCDAAVSPAHWQRMVSAAADASFNAITVDGDTSTNDTVIALANGGGGSDAVPLAPGSPDAERVQALLTATMTDLAKAVARDGEGATVLLEVRVTGASSAAAARTIARTVASSSLTKAAVFGRDPNWGRIAAAAGRAGVPFDAARMDIDLGPYALMRGGQPLAFDAAAASAYMKTKASAPPERYLTEDDTVVIGIRVGDGPGEGVAWGCDLSYKYVEINAEYTT